MPVFRAHDAASDDSYPIPTPLSWTPVSSRASSRTLAEPYTILPKEKRQEKLKQVTNATVDARETITISGVTLTPTVVFDTFWKFAAERKALDDRRRAGGPWPWTEDPILQSYFFCNTFRVLDKQSQYIIREVIEKGSQKPEEVAFRVILYNLFTRIETWELLRDEVGPLEWAKYNRNKYVAVLREAKDAGKPLYTGAFQKPAPKFEHSAGYVNHLILLEVFMDNELHKKCISAWNMADVYEWLVSFPSMGEFSTYQLMLNLSYSKVLNFHRNDFVVPGPGASSGLTKMFGKSAMAAAISANPDFEVEAIRWLTDNQKYHFERLGLEPPVLGPQKLPMDVADIEHTLCEVDKYSREAHPSFKGKRKELWRKYETRTSLPKAVFPKAWKHPARNTPRIRENKRLVVEKRYSVSRIKTHRDTKNGREYLVHWWGYPDSDDTWEPEATLEDDAKGAVEDYRAKLKGKGK
ncbi:hypothetical protein D9756_010887 [Leucocoprinus leucothites]|uniref:Chromo domain-containing protein n=1 Tax=Leucocoprinus leucothites TaxID=201217 RepID=A0A8H5FQE6_9AGAR|nr:hypothetical protein D9756_010887 [Leucoagaricus leucothites]